MTNYDDRPAILGKCRATILSLRPIVALAMAVDLADGVSKRGSSVVNAPRRHGSNVTFAFAMAILLVVVGVSAARGAAIPVQLVKTGTGFQLLRGGKPYFIKGAGGEGPLRLLKQCGGNSLRTWGADPSEVRMDEVQAQGLTVTIGIWLGHKEQGFNYNDPEQVKKQYDHARSVVLQYRDAAPLLVWGLGNEMEGFDTGDDPAVWKAVEDIAKMVKELDPNHPTMTVIAEVKPSKIQALNQYCPDIDIIGINSCAGCPTIPQRYKDAGGVKPYIVTEFSQRGQWEVQKAPWGAPMEITSTEKADYYRKAYMGAIANQPMCLGGYAFHWGIKREVSATWYSMLLPNGDKTGVIDTMIEMWTGNAPKIKAPTIQPLTIDGAVGNTPPTFAPGSSVSVRLAATDPQNDPLTVDWEMEHDPAAYSKAGAPEETPQQFPSAIVHGDLNGATITMPDVPGGYRLYAYVTNRHHEVATANIVLGVTKAAVEGGVN